MYLFKRNNIANPYKYFESNCILCNSEIKTDINKLKYTTEICTNCNQLGFSSKTLSPVRIGNKQIIDLKSITGLSLNKRIIHTFYLGKEVPKQLQLYFLSNLKKLNAEGIFWVDDEKKELVNKTLQILSSNTSPPIKFAVRTTSDLLNEFKNHTNCSYLNKKIRNEIIQMIFNENSGYFKKTAYSTDILRIIALLLHGGLYLDANIRISEKISNLLEIPLFGAKFIAIDCPFNVLISDDYHALSNIDYGREASVFANQSLNHSTKSKLYSKFHDNYYFSRTNMKIRPECSAILGNKGALFFDIVLYDILDKFKIRNKVYNYYLNEKHSRNPNKNVFLEYMNSNLSKSINTRHPIIINAMLMAQRFIMLKVDIFNENYFYFDNCQSKNNASLRKELNALGYKGAIYFNAHGHRFIKYYSHSHKSQEIPEPHSSKFEKSAL